MVWGICGVLVSCSICKSRNLMFCKLAINNENANIFSDLAGLVCLVINIDGLV